MSSRLFTIHGGLYYRKPRTSELEMLDLETGKRQVWDTGIEAHPFDSPELLASDRYVGLLTDKYESMIYSVLSASSNSWPADV